MTVTIELPNEAQRRLVEKAKLKGQSVESYLEDLVQTDIGLMDQFQPHEGKKDTRTTEEWIKAFNQWTASHQHLPFEADDSRDSIYDR